MENKLKKRSYLNQKKKNFNVKKRKPRYARKTERRSKAIINRPQPVGMDVE